MGKMLHMHSPHVPGGEGVSFSSPVPSVGVSALARAFDISNARKSCSAGGRGTDAFSGFPSQLSFLSLSPIRAVLTRVEKVKRFSRFPTSPSNSCKSAVGTLKIFPTCAQQRRRELEKQVGNKGRNVVAHSDICCCHSSVNNLY